MSTFDLQPITAARQSVAETQAQLTANAVTLAQLAAERDRLLRQGSSPDPIDAQLMQLKEQRQGLQTQVTTQVGNIRDLSEAIAVLDLPERLVGSLDAAFPIALLPVRLETRFFNQNTELRIRIFPDQIHIDAHEPELTPAEVEAGQAYWQQRWTGDIESANTAWKAISQKFRASRAAWIVQITTPTNLDQLGQGGAPIFPEVTLKASSWSRPKVARLLPDRWVAIGYRQGQELFRKWGSYVPDSLNVTPNPDPHDETGLPEGELPIDEAMRWAIDYDRALQVGMAITVTQADVKLAGAALADGMDRLVVLGVDWTLPPAQASQAIATVLSSHQYSDHVAFVTPGTPTNNTTAARSGYQNNDQDWIDTLNPTTTPAIDPVHSASRRLSTVLGLPSDWSHLDRAPHATLREQQTTSLMFDALWAGTPGHYAKDLLAPILNDDTIALVREHVVRYLQPAGPLPTLRLGAQPYGILPVIVPQLKPEREDGFEAKLVSVLSQLRDYWSMGLSQVPHLGRNRNAQDNLDPDKDLLEILQMSPLAATARFRRVIGPEVNRNTKEFEKFSNIQTEVIFRLVRWGFFGWEKTPKIMQMATEPKDYLLPVPWVQKGDPSDQPLQSNYIQAIAALTRSGRIAGGPGLNAQADGDALLQVLLAYAALQELDNTSSNVLKAHLRAIGMETSSLAALSIEQIHIEPLPPSPQGSAQISTLRELAAVSIPSLTGNLTVSDYIAQQLALVGPERAEYRGSKAFLDSLDGLATRPVPELERAFRGVLDCYSHRLDAWFTSLATRRLQTLRSQQPVGLHIGGFGWVENLKPDNQPDSLGYLHAPSLTHAATAAILRSGYLSHSDAEHEALNIDLSSDRVRTALNIIQGVAQGQPLAALLGYRFERRLRERGLALARFILPIRKLSPLRTTSNPQVLGSLESIAARDVVDGIGLLERWQKENRALLAPLNDLNPTADEQTIIAQELDHLVETMDAASDLLMAETVYQVALGNLERAGAAMHALDRQERPVEPEVIQTPRSGISYTQRLLVLLSDDTLAEGWAGIPLDPRALAEPRLNGWISQLIGNPNRIRIAAEIRQGETVTPLELTLTELNLSPLSLVIATAAAGAGQPSELEERLVHLFASRFPAGDAETQLVLLDGPSAGTDAIGLGALRVLLEWIRALISDRRFADGRDLSLPEAGLPPGLDVAQLASRSEQAVASLEAAIASLSGPIETPGIDFSSLRSALEPAAQLGIPGAVPRFMPAVEETPETLAALLQQATTVYRALQSTRTRIQQQDEQWAKLLADSPQGELVYAKHHIDRIRAVLGEGFPVLPRFQPPNASELSASLADRSALLGGDDLAALTWLPEVAAARPATEALSNILTAAELLSPTGTIAKIGVMQLPHQPGQRWTALPFDNAAPTTIPTAISSVGNFDPTQPTAGLVVDAWNELIPNATETTGISFHYDAPGARAPQSLILAVPPDLTAATWDFDTLLNTVLETANLMQIRGVGPKEIGLLGGLLPAVYLPDNFTKDVVPSINLFRLATKYSSLVNTRVLGRL
jgi:hypothetical protein